MTVKELVNELRLANDISIVKMVGNDGYMVDAFNVTIDKQRKIVTLVEDGRRGTKATDGCMETLPQWAFNKIKELEKRNNELNAQLGGFSRENVFYMENSEVIKVNADNKLIEMRSNKGFVVKPESKTHLKITLDK
jgi:hypothetical protein